jgi:two-component system, NarL family, nitrate/nitrite response regulator NarL
MPLVGESVIAPALAREVHALHLQERRLEKTWRIEAAQAAGQSIDGRVTDRPPQVRHRPTVAVLDLRRPAGDPAGVMAALIQEHVQTRVVILSDSLTGASAHAALASGVSACVSKCADADELRCAVLRVARGERIVSPSLLDGLLAEIPARATAPASALSARERAILELVAIGHTSREIGQRLYLAPSTVKTYMNRVYEKLGVQGRTAAVVEALRRGELSEHALGPAERAPAVRAPRFRQGAAGHARLSPATATAVSAAAPDASLDVA